MKTPQHPPSLNDLLGKLTPERVAPVLSKTGMVDQEGRYLHWDQLRRRPPPEGLSVDEWWVGTRFARSVAAEALPFTDKAGKAFSFTEPPLLKRVQRFIDMNAAGALGSGQHSLTLDDSKKYLRRSLAEEPFSSSLIEGAATTRDIAKEMIFKNRPPRTRDERMVLNNYKGMEFVKEIQGEDLSPPLILELHRIMTEETLDQPDAVGRLRTQKDRVAVIDESTNEVLHMPPDASELPQRMERLCKFANTLDDDTAYCHPLIRAMAIHFMLAYDHPFVDGNGRTARALFYWSLMRSGYWLMKYTSISSVIAQSPTDYYRAFLFSEADEGDLTYFFIHQAEVAQAALQKLHDYADEKRKENKSFQTMLDIQQILSGPLNERQTVLLHDFTLGHNKSTTLSDYQERFRVSYITARNDLEDLVARKIAKKSKIGRNSIYSSIDKVSQRLQDSMNK